MNTEKILVNSALGLAAVLTVITVVLIIGQAYVRWALNQNFTFLGGGELEVLTLSVVVLTLGLLHYFRVSKNS